MPTMISAAIAGIEKFLADEVLVFGVGSVSLKNVDTTLTILEVVSALLKALTILFDRGKDSYSKSLFAWKLVNFQKAHRHHWIHTQMI